ncbi:MAG TPA: hypothetical protein VF183_00500 [Acidimicrobiales bacterium]
MLTLDDLTTWPDLSYELGLTDGLPVHPPLRATVDALVAATGREPDDVVAVVPPRDGVATVEVIAANAAMAGARPAEMPVIVAAIEAMAEPSFNLRGVQCTTHGCWPLTIVSGPIAHELGMATAESVFSGGGSRASVAIGRAVRLVLWNVGGSVPGEPVKEVFGHPGRFAFAVAESVDTPWEPFHRSRGVDAPSAVTVFACEAPHSVAMWGCDDEPVNRLDQVADVMRTKGNNNAHTMGEVLVCFTPSEARHLAARGLSRADVQDELFRLARRRLGDLRPRGPLRPDNSPEHWYTWWPDWVDQSNDHTLVPVVERPSDIHVLVCGADSIPWAAVLPGWGHLGGFAVTVPLGGA